MRPWPNGVSTKIGMELSLRWLAADSRVQRAKTKLQRTKNFMALLLEYRVVVGLGEHSADRSLIETAPVALPFAHTATAHTHPCTEFSQPCPLRARRFSDCGCALCTARPLGSSCMRLRTQRLHQASYILPLRIGAGLRRNLPSTACLRCSPWQRCHL